MLKKKKKSSTKIQFQSVKNEVDDGTEDSKLFCCFSLRVGGAIVCVFQNISDYKAIPCEG